MRLFIRANPKGIVEKTSLAATFLVRKLEEYEVLRQEIEALQGEVGPWDSEKGVKFRSGRLSISKQF